MQSDLAGVPASSLAVLEPKRKAYRYKSTLLPVKLIGCTKVQKQKLEALTAQ